MNKHRHAPFARSLLLIALMASLPACGKKSTNPSGGGRELDSGSISPSLGYSHTFANQGTFAYHCTIHGLSMSGTVTVNSSAASPASVSIVDNSYSPSSLTVGAGSMVTWTNNGGVSHTVTSN